jgi:hypothetical protein
MKTAAFTKQAVAQLCVWIVLGNDCQIVLVLAVPANTKVDREGLSNLFHDYP